MGTNVLFAKLKGNGILARCQALTHMVEAHDGKRRI